MKQKQRAHVALRPVIDTGGDARHGRRVIANEMPAKVYAADVVPHGVVVGNLANVVANHLQQRGRHVLRPCAGRRRTGAPHRLVMHHFAKPASASVTCVFTYM